MIWLLLFAPLLRERAVNRYDVLERNVVIRESGEEFRQWITWDWDAEAGAHRCQWWASDRGEQVRRTRDGWRVVVGGAVIECRQYRETRTLEDPEVADRDQWPTGRRRVVRW